MTGSSVKKFRFRSGNDDFVDVHIPEVMESSYGMYVWPCAPVLAQYVWFNRQNIPGKRILEIGAGTALPGILASKLGAWVTLSDASHLPQCLENSRKSTITNEVHAKVKVIGVTWGQFSPELIQLGAVDYIFGSDSFYDTKDFENILITVAYLCDKNPNTQFWTTYQERRYYSRVPLSYFAILQLQSDDFSSADRTIVPLLEKWNLTCRHIPLEEFDGASSRLAGTDLPGDHTIHMMIITRKK